MYEIEIKVELTEQERSELLVELPKHGFEFVESTPQDDFYVEAKVSQFAEYGGKYDLKRYRHEGEDYIYTEKVWELIDGVATRREIENVVTKDEFDEAIVEYPNASRVTKVRDWYSGSFEGQGISLTIDGAKFSHSPAVRYFVEAEIAVVHADETAAARSVVLNFLTTILKRDEIVESPGMFTMVSEKR